MVVEARNRIGGRVKPVDLDGQEVDLGASWVHEMSRANPLADYLGKIGVRIDRDLARSQTFERFTGKLSRSEERGLERRAANFIQVLPQLRNQLGAGASVERSQRRWCLTIFSVFQPADRYAVCAALPWTGSLTSRQPY